MLGSDAEQAPLTRIFIPANATEQIRGWLVHCHKSRDRHDMMARWLDARQRRFAALAILLSTIAALTVTAELDRSGAVLLGAHPFGVWARLVVVVASIAAAILTAWQREARYGERAESHRRKAEAYKALIWEIELRLPLVATQDGRTLEAWGTAWIERFRAIERDFQVVVPQRIVDAVNVRYRDAAFREKAEQLIGADHSGVQRTAAD